MLNGFITIWLLLTVLTVTGCASTLQPATEGDKQPTKQLPPNCNTASKQILGDYPWSVIGHNTTSVARYHSLGISQSLEAPRQFTLCSDCPCPTAKQSVSTHTSSKATKTSNRTARTTVRFDHASSDLGDSDRQLLIRFFKTLSESAQLTITGYTDESAPGGTITNETLALNRATRVRDFLISLGLQEN